uniref:Uncharacterized protein n=1 Tax=Steinernema glaseri TaxID=37863 RepID=A0A1I7Z1U3_9BILA
MKFAIALLCLLTLVAGIVQGALATNATGTEAPKKQHGFVEGRLPHDGVTRRPMKKVRRPVGETREERIKRQDYYYYYYYYY